MKSFSLSKNKKKILFSALLFVVAFTILFAIPKPAKAGWPWDSLLSGALEIFARIASVIAEIIFFILGKILSLAGSLFNEVISNSSLQKFTQANIVQVGWKITLGIVNMFFGLILLIVSFATILQLSSYGWKAILPKLILVAILINFSLVIGGVIIDFTQVLTKFFFDKIGGTHVSENIMDKIKIQNTLNSPEELKGGNWAKTKSATDTFFRILINLVMGSIILALAAFTLAAGAFLLFLRVISLWFLLIMAPFAWFSYIIALPGMSGWNEWWGKFFKQAFFAPAYALMIYIALEGIRLGGLSNAVVSGQGAVDGSTGIMNAAFIINYVIIIALLWGALTVAQTMGAAGASTVLNYANKGKAKAAQWGKGAAMKPVNYGVTKAGVLKERAIARTSATFGKAAKWVGWEKAERRLGSREALRRQALTERPEFAKYKKMVGVMSPQDVLKEANKGGIKGMIATQTAKEKNFLKDANAEQAQRMTKNYRNYKQEHLARDIEERRPDSITDDTTRDERIKSARAKGVDKEWSDKVFDGAMGQRVMEQLRDQMQADPEEYGEIIKSWGIKTRIAAETALKSIFNDNFADPANAKARRMHAYATGKTTEAFSDSGGNINHASLGTHVQSLTPAQLSKIGANRGQTAAQNETDLRATARHITVAQLSAIRGELSGTQKQIIGAEIIGTTPAADPRHVYVTTTPGWI